MTLTSPQYCMSNFLRGWRRLASQILPLSSSLSLEVPPILLCLAIGHLVLYLTNEKVS